MTKSNERFPIYYESIGNPNSPCIVLIGGIGGQLIQWSQEFTQHLANNGFYVVTFDNRDAGLSKSYDELGTPDFTEMISAKRQGENPRPPYTLSDMAKDVILLLDKLNIQKAHIIGSSMGGMIAQLFAIEHPERILTLTCIGTTSGDPNLPSAKKEVLDFFSTSLQKSNQDLQTYINDKLALHKIYNPYDFDEDKASELFKKTYHRGHNVAGFNRQLIALITAESREEKLKRLNVPTLIIHGDSDPVFSLEHGKQLADIIPTAYLQIIERMGHGIPPALEKNIADMIVSFIKNKRNLHNE